jgi:hypothetical protein
MYYRLTHSVEQKVIGVKDGMAQVELVKNHFREKSNYDSYINYFLDFNEDGHKNLVRFPSFDVKLEYLQPKKNAKLTDFLCFAPAVTHNFLINKKVQGIFRNFNLPPYKLYEAGLFLNGALNRDFSFWYCPSFDFDVIDFQKSRFSTGNERIGNRRELQVYSEEDLKKITSTINRDKIVLKSDFDRDLDLFDLLMYDSLIISERLKDALEKEQVSGVDYQLLSESKFIISD